jgi:enoyl-CoA hydratase/carnithine racemase
VKNQNSLTTKSQEIRLSRRSPAYWRVTFDHPPLNIFGPEGILEMAEIITELETDEHVKVVVFDSAVEGFFLNHSDFLGKLEDLTGLPAGPTGLQAWPDILVRLTRASVVSIALIRGRATGNGSEIALACDMRFASREKLSCRSSKSVPAWYLAADPWRDCRASSEGDVPWKCFWAGTTFEPTWPSSTAM